jgi:hypothetical protein
VKCECGKKEKRISDKKKYSPICRKMGSYFIGTAGEIRKEIR